MTAAERRERVRWRRARGIMPWKPAQKPWLAEGVSRSTWYRRKKARKRRTLAAAQNCKVSLPFARAEAFVAQLQTELAEVARCHQVMAAIIGELSP